MTTLDATLASRDEALLAFVGDATEYDPSHFPAPTRAQLLAAAEPRDDEIGLHPTGELEPGIVDAIRQSIHEFAAAIWAMDDVHTANIKLRRSGDPLGLMDGDGITADVPETNAPTPERVAGRGDFQSVDHKAAGREPKHTVWRAVPLVEAMVRRGQIAKDQAASYTEAARRFYSDFVIGHKGASTTARYGELAGGGGTPASQQQVHYYTDKFGRQYEVPGPEDRRHDAHTSWWRACQAIGIVKCSVTGRPMPSETLHWMLVLVCEDYLAAVEKTPTLEDAGRAYLGYKRADQASAAGAALVKSGLERLVVHYGIE